MKSVFNRKEQAEHLYRVVTSDRFLRKQGLGNEVPFFICPFPAEFAVGVADDRRDLVKDAAKLATQIDELHEWEREVVFPLAQQKIEIDLDDGVKANYPKFGTALKKIPGLS